MLKEFKDFIAKGNVMDMAVGIIIGAAFTAIVGSLGRDLINPIISSVMGGVDFSGMYACAWATASTARSPQLKKLALRSSHMAALSWRSSTSSSSLRSVHARSSVNKMKKEEEEAPAAPAGPTQEELLAEILNALKK